MSFTIKASFSSCFSRAVHNFLVLTFLSALGSVYIRGSDFMETLTVRLLSAKDGKPLAERQIQVVITRLLYSPEKSDPRIFSGTEYTNGSGIARFKVNLDLPPKSTISIFGLTDYCSAGDYDWNVVWQFGAASKRKCPHRPIGKFQVHANPGEVVFFSGEYSRWERALYFPWAG